MKYDHFWQPETAEYAAQSVCNSNALACDLHTTTSFLIRNYYFMVNHVTTLNQTYNQQKNKVKR